MKIRLERYEPRFSIHIIWGVLALLVLTIVGLFQNLAPFSPPCLFHKITGLPCLTCGATRSAISLATFDLSSSLRLNPLLPLFVLAVMAFSALNLGGLVLRKRIDIQLSPTDKKAARWIVIALVAANWIYLILAGV